MPPASADARLRRFDVVHALPGVERRLGTVQVDDACHLSILAAEPGEETRLQDLVDELNAEPHLQVDAAPPAGAPRFGMYGREVARGTPGFEPALRAHLQQYFDIALRPA